MTCHAHPNDNGVICETGQGTKPHNEAPEPSSQGTVVRLSALSRGALALGV
jgi:hypothetical protein